MVQTNDAEIVSMGIDYLTVICVFGFGQLFQLIFEKILQSTGRTSYTMVMQIVGAVINIILDRFLFPDILDCRQWEQKVQRLPQ